MSSEKNTDDKCNSFNPDAFQAILYPEGLFISLLCRLLTALCCAGGNLPAHRDGKAGWVRRQPCCL